MYVTTFYSYKGGVGRSMALVNVAALLVKAGKRVLIVDFDLEAPGLTSYAPFREAHAHQGLVEYVHDFLDTNEAPDAAAYLVRCEIDGAPIWLMPAGRHTETGYAASFSAINWQSLYAERDGFLLFEDLKQQWAEFENLGFDYVLIDSRTGHTDIGGICTRQLPDAVVVMFLPTPQNIEGLRPIVRGIRREGFPVRRERVRLHFCPSNLPDLDDQELILKSLLEEAQRQLGYEMPASEIYHYGALDLLQQPVYAVSSPNSRLTTQYEELLTSIIQHNLRDRDGALAALNRLQDGFEAARRIGEQRDLQDILGEAAIISSQFNDDVEIAWGLAELAERMSRPEDELQALNTIVSLAKENRGAALLKRATVLAALNDRVAALDDLTRLLTSEPSTLFEIVPAMDLIGTLDREEWRGVIERGLDNPHIDSFAKGQMLTRLLDDAGAISAVLRLSRSHLDTVGRHQGVHSALVLALIAEGQFEDALDVIGRDRAGLLARESLPDLFNFAIAEWGAQGVAPKDLFSAVVQRAGSMRRTNDPNGLQCFALARAVVGQFDEALDDLRRAELASRGLTWAFSCWRYLTVSSAGFSEDLREMRELIQAKAEFSPPARGGALKASNAPHGA